MHLHGAIPPMSDQIPYSVQNIVRRAMEKDAARRYQSAGEMMQNCQQVFAELNQGGVSIGGGGAPRTMIASNPQQFMGQPAPGQHPQQQMQPQMHPQMQPQMHPQMSGLAPQQQGGYNQSAPQAKTMMAQSPFAPGGPMQGQPMQGQPMQGQQPQGQGGPGGFVQSSPMQKTIVAGMAPAIMGGQLMPQGTPQGFPPQQQPGGPPQGGPNKTVLLQPTDGVVSMARPGAVAPQPGQGAMPGVQQGASTLYWIICLMTGIAVGVIGYLIVLQL
jgi:hypothetical protein